MSQSVFSRLLEIIKARFSPKEVPTLMKVQEIYKSELLPNRYTYTISQGSKKPVSVKLEFTEGNFCHLFSIGSIVKNVTPDLEQFSGMKGWKNIEEGRITFKTLRQMDPQQFAYYQQEYGMVSQLAEMVKNPKIVRFDKSKVPGSRLECEYILYGIFGARVVHLGISRDEDGTYFPRSFFIREVSQDKSYPTKYIANMPECKVKTRVSKK